MKEIFRISSTILTSVGVTKVIIIGLYSLLEKV